MQRDAIWRSAAGRQGDHALDRPRAKQRPPDPASRPPRSDRRRQQEHGHAAGLQPRKSMLNPRQLRLRPWWQAIGPPGIGRQLFMPPVPLVERRIAQNQVGAKLAVRISAQRVAHAHVDPCDVHSRPRRPAPAPLETRHARDSRGRDARQRGRQGPASRSVPARTRPDVRSAVAHCRAAASSSPPAPHAGSKTDSGTPDLRENTSAMTAISPTRGAGVTLIWRTCVSSHRASKNSKIS